MATTSYGVNNALAVKLYSKKLAVEVLKETEIADYVGEDDNSVIQLKTENMKSAGDKVTYGLRMQLSSPGIQGDGTLEGNEEALTTYSDSVLIDQLRTAVRSSGRMSEQRVPFEVRQEALNGVKDWWVDRLATCFFNQLAGNAAQTDTRYTGNNATTAADSSHQIWSSASHTTDATLDSGDTMTLAQIDRCVTLAKTLTPAIRPIKIRGKDHYVIFIHPYQTLSLWKDASTTGGWSDIALKQIQGGDMDSPIFNGALGIYKNVIIREDSRIPLGFNASTLATISTVRRAVFCGAQAGMLSFGLDNGPSKFTWVEELFDYKNQLGVSAGCIFGMKKTTFNNKDFSTIVVSSYATTP